MSEWMYETELEDTLKQLSDEQDVFSGEETTDESEKTGFLYTVLEEIEVVTSFSSEQVLQQIEDLTLDDLL